MPDEPTYQTDKLKNLTVAVLLDAIDQAKKGKNSSAKWLATPYATSLAESVGFDAALWSDIWSHFRSANGKPDAKREQKAAFTRNQRLVIEQVAAGHTQQAAAAMVGVTGAKVSVWKRGGAFRFAIEEAKRAAKEKKNEKSGKDRQ